MSISLTFLVMYSNLFALGYNLGIFLKDIIENWLGNVKILGFAFLITALLLFLVRKFDGSKKDKDLTVVWVFMSVL